MSNTPDKYEEQRTSPPTLLTYLIVGAFCIYAGRCFKRKLKEWEQEQKTAGQDIIKKGEDSLRFFVGLCAIVAILFVVGRIGYLLYRLIF